ncbi:MAG TPA: metal-dependent transcriptional regulator [Ignavibacteriaceae bacterium]|nr:metal-dependent transcriptional regulator [Ignavibacteriaceae bacterium]
MQNISKEDYLGIIYKHKNESGEIKPNIIAEKLQISNAAVTDMLKKLSKDGHINYEKYKGIRLTASGEEYAKNMVRRHRIWEVFLNQIVGMPWEKVHEEANRLEHSASDELINRLEEMLEYPEYDPHGDPIPSKEGKVPKLREHVPLEDLKQGQVGTVIRVNDFDDQFLVYISKIGINLNEVILVKEKRKFDKSMQIIVNGKPCNISSKVAENIFVEIKKK